MAITDKDRTRLYQYFEETMGEERATTLMDALPPVGWGDVATKADLEQLRLDTKKDLEGLRKDVAHAQEVAAKDLAHVHEMLDLKIDSTTHKLASSFLRELRIQTGAIVTLVVVLGGVVRLF